MNNRQILFVVLILGGFAFANFLGPPILKSRDLKDVLLVWLGIVCAEAVIVGIWGVLAAPRILIRLSAFGFAGGRGWALSCVRSRIAARPA